MNLTNLREDYQQASLDISSVARHPVEQFNRWLQLALAAALKEPNAMTLATCTPDGKPSARIVLLKGLDQEGFVFYTNYKSRKGFDLHHNPQAALVFAWLELEKQVRVEGVVEQLSEEESTTYFQSRPKGSQIGAWASPQSQVIKNRAVLEHNTTRLQVQYKTEDQLPRPAHWGGFRVKPTMVEFWQGRSNRLHDRIRYERQGTSWKIDRLAP